MSNVIGYEHEAPTHRDCSSTRVPCSGAVEGGGLTLGARISELRLAKRMTAATLADKAGISRSYVTRLESNRVELPSKRVLWSLAQSLTTTPDDLLAAAGYMPARNRTIHDSGLEIAFRYVATLPKEAQREILDFVADVSLQHKMHSGDQSNGQQPDTSRDTANPGS